MFRTRLFGLRALLILGWLMACQTAPPPLPVTPTAAPATATASTLPSQPPATPPLPATATPFITRIRDIQGAGHVSPLVFKIVENVPGVVTAIRPNGFYLQDPQPDDDAATSEALFVFTNTTPTVQIGDAVSVRGLVSEARPGGETSTNLATTQLETPSVTLLARGQPLPPPVVIGQGGRVPPTAIIDDDSQGQVERTARFDPAEDGLDFYESLENMLVQVNDAVVVGARNRFGEIVVLGDGGAGAGQRTARGGIIIRPTDYNPERIFLDDEILRSQGQATPTANVGDRLAGPLVGPLDYSFGNFKIQLTSVPSVVAGNLERTIAAPPAPGELSVASFNVENLDPTDVGRFEALAAQIVTHLRSPDLISIEEIQDNNGAFNDAVVDASRTYSLLTEAIRAVGGPSYEVRQIDPVDDQDGGEPGGNIRVGFMFRTDRGLSFVDRPGATSTTPVALDASPPGLRLTYSPGRLAPGNAAFQSSRKPLVGEFQYAGQALFVISNHLVSKGGDHPLFGRFQPPVLGSEKARREQAQVLAGFVRQMLDADPNANIILLGDLNDFPFAAPLQILRDAGLHILADTLPDAERYSYVFDGNSQVLDHILISPHLADTAAPQFEYVHINAEFADRLSDHDPTYLRLRLAPTAPPQTVQIPTINWNEARAYIGQTVRAEGAIVATRNTGRVTYLNFSRTFQTDLKVVIFPREAVRFPQPPEILYDGKTIRVTGRIEEYQGAPEIIVRDPSQIEIIR